MNKDGLAPTVSHLPIYLATNWLNSDDSVSQTEGEFAFNHALLISGLIRYYVFTGDRRALEPAKKASDWHIANSCAPSGPLPYLCPSFVQWQKDGTWKDRDAIWTDQQWGIEPDKSAYMGYSFMKLYAATGERKYLEAAKNIASTLRKLQRADGSWPFRISPKTGEVTGEYSCSQLWYVWLFENLAKITSDKSYLENRDKAFRWLLDNPVKTNRWSGLYGDNPNGNEALDQWVALETAMYLLDNRDADPGYVGMAKDIFGYVDRKLVVPEGLHHGVRGIVEQTQVYPVVLVHHNIRLAEGYAKLWEATGDSTAKKLALQIANSTTWCLMSDGKMRLGFGEFASGIPLVPLWNDQYCRIMTTIPETAPDGENHILQTSGFAVRAAYSRTSVKYATLADSHDVLKVVKRPMSVLAGGQVLSEASVLRNVDEGWHYDENTHVLRIKHKKPDVVIKLL
ncbi:MAG: hypothetical protein HYX78_08990 [Armatimonadetes bacterium]|nr:hypothetical protein [Armatimonadota bacterium]